jgi:hypothetical protein
MPIPAPSKSYKQRLHVDRANDEGATARVHSNHNKHTHSTSVDIYQSVDASMRDELTTNVSANTAETSMRPPSSRISSYQGEVDGAKRRSLLPQPGQSRYSLHQDTTAPKTDSISTQKPAPGRLRPRSMYQIATTQPAQDRSDNQVGGASRTIRPPVAISKPSEPQTAGLGRSRSLRRPATSTQSAQSKPNATHSRTQSSSNVSGLRHEANHAESAVARPKSLLVAAGRPLKSSTSATESAPAATRSSARLAGLSRTANFKAKVESSNGGATIQSSSRLDDATAPHPQRREPLREDITKTARPAFSTLQQHFTPRKTSKAPTSTFLHPGPAPGAGHLPPEITSLQSELLQLHLLHASSAEATQQWNLDARRCLHKKFEEVASFYRAMLESERAGQEQKNLQALLEWSGGSSSVGLVEYIQILSGPLHELPSLLGAGGRFERLIGEFEHWISRVEHLSSRRLTSTLNDGNSESVEGLGDSWKAENAALVRKVTSFARDLDQVQRPSEGSSIASIVDTCKALLNGLSEELHVIQTIEAAVVAKEKEWVEARLQAFARNIGSTSVDGKEDVAAAWRT